MVINPKWPLKQRIVVASSFARYACILLAEDPFTDVSIYLEAIDEILTCSALALQSASGTAFSDLVDSIMDQGLVS